MVTAKVKTEEQVLEDKIKNLIAVGAPMAANWIPCFEHLYENAINSGITLAKIKPASDIAGQVKKGAHIALINSMNELTGIDETQFRANRRRFDPGDFHQSAEKSKST